MSATGPTPHPSIATATTETSSRDVTTIEASEAVDGYPPKRRRKDIRACGACRRSKVKCNGDKPCARCARNQSDCVYLEVAKDPTTERVESLEAEVLYLKSSLKQVQSSLAGSAPVSGSHQGLSRTLWGAAPPPGLRMNEAFADQLRLDHLSENGSSPLEFSSAASVRYDDARGFGHRSTQGGWTPVSPLRTRPHLNVVQKGFVTEQQASIWFRL
jgi:hypothetical protein